MTVTARLLDDAGNQLLSMGWADADVILAELDLGYPQPREATSPLSGQDGEWDTTTLVGGRAITADVVLPDQPGPAQDTLRAVMHPGRRAWLHVSRDDWAADRRIRVRGASLASRNGRPPFTAQLGWKAPAATLEDVDAATVTLNPVAPGSGGLTMPETFPMTFAPGLVPGASNITVGGTATASPVIDVYGPCTGPLFRVVDTGAQLSFPTLTVQAGDYLHIDVAARSITLNNNPAQSQYHRLDFATSAWPVLTPGATQVVFSPASASAGCVAVLSWHAQWL